MLAVTELESITEKVFFEQIVPAQQPVVIRGLVEQWPLCAWHDNHPSFAQALQVRDSGHRCYTIVAPPQARGRFFYGDRLRGQNFAKTQSNLSDALSHIAAQAGSTEPHAIALQAVAANAAINQFSDDHPTPLSLPAEPTMWLGTPGLVAAHFDLHDNLACVVHGQRRFHLFPPEQATNLYLGPTLDAPGGVPISLVDVRAPDLVKFPKFAEAQAQGQLVTLHAGDALYIPSPWWHAVESLDEVNLLVNYWWTEGVEPDIGANQSLMHSMLSIAQLSPHKRRAWRALFDHLVFRLEHDPSSHLPDDLKDIVTTMTDEQRRSVFQYLASALSDSD